MALRCAECDKTFCTKQVLDNHVRTHFPPDIACTYAGCTKMFRQMISLEQHMCTHTGIYPFNCDRCKKGFVKKVGLAKHTCRLPEEQAALEEERKRKAEAAAARPKKFVRVRGTGACAECDAEPRYSVTGEKPGTHCATHAPGGFKCVYSIYCSCGTMATFGMIGQKPTACAAHVEVGMTEGSNRSCSVESCTNAVCYGPSFSNARRCSKHKEPSDVYTVHAICDNCTRTVQVESSEVSLCRLCSSKSDKYCTECLRLHKGDVTLCREAYYARPGETMAVFCKEHRGVDDIGVAPQRKRCVEPGCAYLGIARYGYDGEKPQWCIEHRPEGSINIQYDAEAVAAANAALTLEEKKTRSGFCEVCGSQANYNVPGERPRWCILHMPKDDPNIINVRRHTCDRCHAYASHKLEGAVAYSRNSPPTHCMRCFEIVYPGIKGIDARSLSYCEGSGCQRYARWGDGETMRSTRCRLHALENQINLKNRKCDDCGYSEQNCMYSLLEDTTHRLCIRCCRERNRATGSIVAWDISSSLCKECGPQERQVVAKYAPPGSKPERCERHVQEGDVYDPTRKCIRCGCDNPTHASALKAYKEGPNSRILCSDCADVNDIKLFQGRCRICEYWWTLSDGKCTNQCGLPTYERKATNHLVRQNDVKTALEKASDSGRIPLFDRADMAIPQIESQERPDFFFTIRDMQKEIKYYLIIEVDENQHSDRVFNEENTRMCEISKEFQQPVYWIRYNPDRYYDENAKCHDPNNEKRFNILVDEIAAIVSGTSRIFDTRTKIGAVLYLFYGTMQQRKHDIQHGHVIAIEDINEIEETSL